MKKLNEEKGSITVYVLVTMLLMISVLTIIYLQTSQKNNAQLKELEKIQQEYQTSIEDLDDSYNEILDKNDMEIYIVLTTPDGKQYDINQWTNQNLKLKIFYPKGVSDDEKYYYKNDERLKYTENEIIEDNCTIRVEYGDKEKEVQITKIDKILPTVTLNPNGENKTIDIGNTTANISAKVEATDNESGVKTIEYQISSSETMPSEDDSNWQEIENGGTISESKKGGKYYIYTKVTDNAGNVNIQKSQEYNLNYEVRYDANGGSGSPSAQVKVPGTALTLSSTKPTRTGYTFLGWATTNDATTAQYQPGGSYTDDNTVILYAIWQINSYIVTYDYKTNGGNSTTATNYEVNYGDSIDLTPTATKNGYTFIGWNTNKDATTKLTSLTMGSSNVILYAIYIDNINPSMGSLTASTTNWTNQNITLTGKATDVGSGISYYQFSTNPSLTASSGGWKSITNSKTEITATYSASINDTYYFYVKDEAGNINKKSIVVSKIDKTAPTINSISTSNITTSSIKATVSASDSQSGIKTYKYYLNGTLKATTTSNSYTYTGLTNATKYTLKVEVIDNANNSTPISTTATTLTAVASIGNNTYTTLQGAVNAVSSNGTKTTITMIRNTTENVTVPSGKNIVLNTNGKTISATGDTLLNYGTLEMTGTGTITSTNAWAIGNFGTFILTSGTITANHDKSAMGVRSGIAYINGGTIKNTSTGVALTNTDSGTVHIQGGTIENSTSSHVTISNTATMYIKNGTIRNTGGGQTLGNIGAGVVYVQGGYIEGRGANSATLGNRAKLYISAGTITNIGGGYSVYTHPEGTTSYTGGNLSSPYKL